jgi:hypothetical protein
MTKSKTLLLVPLLALLSGVVMQGCGGGSSGTAGTGGSVGVGGSVGSGGSVGTGGSVGAGGHGGSGVTAPKVTIVGSGS